MLSMVIKRMGLGICLLSVCLSCQDPEVLTDLGADFIDESSRVVLVDTFSLQASTILLDSLSTSGTGQILVGTYWDKYLGEVTSSSYFQMSFRAFLPQDLEYVVDSIEIILSYSGYYEGDTNQYQHIYVHQVLEDIDPDENGQLFNNNQFEVSPDPLASAYFKARPGLGGELSIRLPDNLGVEWMEIITQQDPELLSVSSFIDEFKGIALLPDQSDQAAILGFNASASTTEEVYDVSTPSSLTPTIRIHYQEIGVVPEAKTYDVVLHTQQLQFNAIQSDRGSTSINQITNEVDLLSSIDADNMVFLQSGVGLMPKIEFPELESLYYLGDGEILKADLVIEPVKGTYGANNPLVNNLILYRTDRNHQVGEALLDPLTGFVIYSTLEKDYLYQENTSYRFPLTDYMNEILKTDKFTENAVLIGFPDMRFQASTESQIFGGPLNKQHTMKLEIYYTIYDSE